MFDHDDEIFQEEFENDFDDYVVRSSLNDEDLKAEKQLAKRLLGLLPETTEDTQPDSSWPTELNNVSSAWFGG